MGIVVYIFNKDYYYTWMSMTKQYFGLVINTVVEWFCPTVVRVSGDASVRDQLKQTEDGRLESDFPDRMVLMANHQVWMVSFCVVTTLTMVDIYGLVLSMVVRLHGQKPRQYLYHPQGVFEVHSLPWSRYAILWLHLHCTELDQRQTTIRK